jgi:restriction system protein
MASERASAGIVVTSGHFTRDAREFASGKPVELIDGPGLIGLIKDVQGARPVEPSPVMRTASSVQACPDCGSIMILRTAKRGAKAGSEFWGCPSYPKCRGTRPA